MFQRENDIVILTTQRFASGEAIFIDCKSKRRDYTVVALIRLLFAARIHTTTKFMCKTELIEIRSPVLDTSSMIL